MLEGVNLAEKHTRLVCWRGFAIVGTINTAMKKTALVSAFMELTFGRVGGYSWRQKKQRKGNKFLEKHRNQGGCYFICSLL